MIATMIPISGDSWHVDINRAEFELFWREIPPFDPFEPICDIRYSVPDIIVYKLINEKHLVYQEQLGRV